MNLFSTNYSQISAQQIDSSLIFNEKDRLGYENASQCLNNPYFLLMPNELGYEFIAKKLNEVTEKIYQDLRGLLFTSPEHNQRIATLDYYRNSNACLLEEATPFEQICALEDWFSRRGPLTEKANFNLANKKYNDYIPVSFTITTRDKAYSLMQAKLGSGKAAPKYYDSKNPRKRFDTWDTIDPWLNPSQMKFIYPLEALEIVRQPNFIASTLLKGNAFEAEIIDQDVRYGVKNQQEIRQEACVEFKEQRCLPWKENVVKIRSAAYILFELYRTHADADICLNTDYKLDVSVTPGDILYAFKESLSTGEIKKKGEKDLYSLLFKTFVVKIGIQSTPNLHHYIIRRLQEFEADV